MKPYYNNSGKAWWWSFWDGMTPKKSKVKYKKSYRQWLKKDLLDQLSSL